MLRHIDDSLKKDLRQSASFEPSSLLFATFGSAGDRLLEISIKRKVTLSLHFTYAWGAPLLNHLQWKLAYF
jgi:hypothetical protein